MVYFLVGNILDLQNNILCLHKLNKINFVSVSVKNLKKT